MNTDQNPEAAPAENPAQTTANLSVALPPPTGQPPPGGGEHDQEQDSAQPLSQASGEAVKPAKPDAIVLSSVLGTLDNLSELEQADFFACEKVLGSGRDGFVQCGLALARIRDGRLYREQYDTFENYCRLRWQYGRQYVHRLISAAQVFTVLSPMGDKKPDNERQVRPLAGLTPEQVKLAWEHAADMAGGGKITERLVKKAVQELQLAGKTVPAAKREGPTKAERRRLIDDTIGQLLVLVSQKADHGLMQAKIEAVYGHIGALFAKPPAKASQRKCLTQGSPRSQRNGRSRFGFACHGRGLTVSDSLCALGALGVRRLLPNPLARPRLNHSERRAWMLNLTRSLATGA